MRAFFGEEIFSYHVDTWKDAMEEIKKGNAMYAVLPIENSTAGIVQDNYDLLTEYISCDCRGADYSMPSYASGHFGYRA